MLVCYLFAVSVIDKSELWLEEDAQNPANWTVWSREDLEERIGHPLRDGQLCGGRALIGREDIVWRPIYLPDVPLETEEVDD